MRTRTTLLALLAAGWAGAVQSQNRPPLTPTRDVVVEYRVEGQATSRAPAGERDEPGRRHGTAAVRVLSAGGKLRVEPAGMPGYVLVDPAADRAIMVLDKLRTTMEVPGWSEIADDLLLNDRMRFTRQGDDRVAGLSCVVWAVQGPQGQDGRICETLDGVVLRAEGRDPRYGSGHLEAEAVTYRPLAANLFLPPTGYRNTDLLNALRRSTESAPSKR